MIPTHIFAFQLNNWNAVLSSLTLAMVPILIFYLIFSQQMIRSITAGAIK